MGEVSTLAGKACLEYLKMAVAQVMAGEAQAIVFAPLNKLAMKLGGSSFNAELDYLANLTKTEHYGEINYLHASLDLPGDFAHWFQGDFESSSS